MKNFSLKDSAKMQWKVLGVKGTALMAAIFSAITFLVYLSVTAALSTNIETQNETVLVSLLCDLSALLFLVCAMYLYEEMENEAESEEK